MRMCTPLISFLVLIWWYEISYYFIPQVLQADRHATHQRSSIHFNKVRSPPSLSQTTASKIAASAGTRNLRGHTSRASGWTAGERSVQLAGEAAGVGRGKVSAAYKLQPAADSPIYASNFTVFPSRGTHFA